MIRCFLAVAIPALLLAVVPGCGGGGGDGAGGPVRLGHLNQDLHQLAFYVAQQKGFFLEEGLEVEVAGVYSSGPEEMAAFQAGSLDAGYVGMAPVMATAASGRAEILILAQANLNGSALVVRDAGAVRALEELRGRKVAVPKLGTVQDFLLRLALEGAGMTMGDLEVVYLAPPEMLSALSSASIDACLVWEPFVSMAESRGLGRVLLDSRDIWEDHPCCVLAVSGEFLRERPREAEALRRAHARATAYVRDNPQEALEMAVAFTGLDAGTAGDAMKRITFTEEFDREAAREYARFLGEQGLAPIGDPDSFVDGLVAPL